MSNLAAVRPMDFALAALAGRVLQNGRVATFAGAATDSRAAVPGQIFFAVKGERVDGFDFCAQAVRAGAAALVVPAARGVPADCAGVTIIAVDDPVLALGALARAARMAFRGRIVGVTGSNGKTTTKELIAAALSSAGRVMRTPGNLNTDIGLPLAVLGARGDEDFWVLEMAMRGPGEIATLGRIAEPHVGLVTNVAAAHVGRLGSIEAVARAKAEIFSTLHAAGVAVLPADEPRLQPFVAQLPSTRVIRFGAVGDGAPASIESTDRRVRLLDFVSDGAAGSGVRIAVGDLPYLVRLPLAGRHNAINAAAALAVVYALGLPVAPAAAALARVALPPHRSQATRLGGRVVLDDCYNANPASMAAALATLAAGARGVGRTFAVLGDMLELGDDRESLHRALGMRAAETGLAGLAAVGPLARHIAAGARAAGMTAASVIESDDPALAARALAAFTRPGDWILVKSSRGGRLERAIEALGDLWGRE